VSWCAVAALWRNGSPDGMLRTLARGVFVAAGVTLFLMPHVRSSAAVQSRQVRALERGFVAIKPRGTSFLQVPAELKSRIQAVSLSIATHAELNNMSGRSHHFLASAALAVRPAIGESRFREVLAMNRAAGVAKHSFPSPLLGGAPARWADAEEALAVALPPVADCGGDSRCSSLSTASARGKVDHIFLSDPWAKFTALRGARSPPVHASAVRRAAVAVVDVGVQKAPPCAIHATEMVPPVAGADTGAPTSLEGSSSTLAVVEKALLNLVDVMTRVVCKVEVLLVSLDARLAGCSSLPAAVEVVDVVPVSCALAPLEPVVAELEERIMRWAEERFSKGTAVAEALFAEAIVCMKALVANSQQGLAADISELKHGVGCLERLLPNLGDSLAKRTTEAIGGIARHLQEQIDIIRQDLSDPVLKVLKIMSHVTSLPGSAVGSCEGLATSPDGASARVQSQMQVASIGSAFGSCEGLATSPDGASACVQIQKQEACIDSDYGLCEGLATSHAGIKWQTCEEIDAEILAAKVLAPTARLGVAREEGQKKRLKKFASVGSAIGSCEGLATSPAVIKWQTCEEIDAEILESKVLAVSLPEVRFSLAGAEWLDDGYSAASYFSYRDFGALSAVSWAFLGTRASWKMVDDCDASLAGVSLCGSTAQMESLQERPDERHLYLESLSRGIDFANVCAVDMESIADADGEGGQDQGIPVRRTGQDQELPVRRTGQGRPGRMYRP